MSLGGLPVCANDAHNSFGAFGPEGARMREQLWILPGADPAVPLRATLFRPARLRDDQTPERLPLVLISHGTDDATRLAVSMPTYYWLSRWFVERGWAVLLPQRRGHGATGGPMAEGSDSCDDPDHYAAGRAAAADIEAAVSFMKRQPFVDPDQIIAAGVSSGGWASLALAARAPDAVKAVINFAGGRGGHAYGRARAVCGKERLVEAARLFGAHARVPTKWYYAANDSYFDPELAEALAQAFARGGGQVDAEILPSYGREGHGIADDRAGWSLWGESLDAFLTGLSRQPQTVGPPSADAAHIETRQHGKVLPAVAPQALVAEPENALAVP